MNEAEHAAEAERGEADEARHQKPDEDQQHPRRSSAPGRAWRATALRGRALSRTQRHERERPQIGQHDHHARDSETDRRPPSAGECTIFLTICKLTKRAVLEALKVVRDPDLQRDIVSLGFIKDLKIDGGRVAFTIELTTPACPVKDQMRDQARAAVMQVPGVSRRRRADERARARSGRRRRHARSGARREERHRGRRRQGRRRQDHRRGEPRDCARQVRQQASASSTPTSTVRTCRSCSA